MSVKMYAVAYMTLEVHIEEEEEEEREYRRVIKRAQDSFRDGRGCSEQASSFCRPRLFVITTNVISCIFCAVGCFL
jgi:hypothetical protein